MSHQNSGLTAWPQLEKSLARLAKAHINSLKPVTANTLVAWAADLYSQLYYQNSGPFDDLLAQTDFASTDCRYICRPSSPVARHSTALPALDFFDDSVLLQEEEEEEEEELSLSPFACSRALLLKQSEWAREDYFDYLSDLDECKAQTNAEGDCSSIEKTVQVGHSSDIDPFHPKYQTIDPQDDRSETCHVTRITSDDEMYSNAFSNQSTQCTSLFGDYEQDRPDSKGEAARPAFRNGFPDEDHPIQHSIQLSSQPTSQPSLQSTSQLSLQNDTAWEPDLYTLQTQYTPDKTTPCIHSANPDDQLLINFAARSRPVLAASPTKRPPLCINTKDLSKDLSTIPPLLPFHSQAPSKCAASLPGPASGIQMNLNYNSSGVVSKVPQFTVEMIRQFAQANNVNLSPE